MTKRDFELIADVLARTKPASYEDDEAHGQWEKTVENFAHRLASTNPNFNRARFLRAAGVE